MKNKYIIKDKSRMFIDDEKAHNNVLYQLRLLDDDDDWNLFCKMNDEDDPYSYLTYEEVEELMKKLLLNDEMKKIKKTKVKKQIVI